MPQQFQQLPMLHDLRDKNDVKYNFKKEILLKTQHTPHTKLTPPQPYCHPLPPLPLFTRMTLSDPPL